MNRFALYALLAGTAMLTACGGGAATGGAGNTVPVSGQSTTASQAAPLTAVDATGAPITAISFASAAPGTVRTFTVQQANFTGLFMETDTCSQVAAVKAASNAGGTAVFRVSPIGGGSCAITVIGDGLQQLTISVGVTSTPILVN